MVKLSDYVFSFLKEKGVRQVFLLPGGGAMHLDDSLGKSGMAYTCFLHEQAAAVAAEAYGQHTGTPGVLLVTSGPGATNAVTGVAAGWIDSTPLIVLSGQAKRADLVGDKGVRQCGPQEVPIVPMVAPVTKYAVQIQKPEEIRYHLEKAYAEATSGRKGPVWLDIPLDVQAARIDPQTLEGCLQAAGAGCAGEDVQEPAGAGYPREDVQELAGAGCAGEAVKKVLKLLGQSAKPLVLAGNGIHLAGATKILHRVVQKLQLPVQTTWKAADMFAEDDPLYAGHPGVMGDRGANLVLQEADFLLVVGCRLDTSVTAFNDANFGKSAKKAVIDIDPKEIARMGIQKEVAAACDAGVFLQQLEQAVLCGDAGLYAKHMQKARQEWLLHCRQVRERYPVITEGHKQAKGYVSAYYFIGELCKLLREDDVIVPESSGGAGEITYQAFRVKAGQKMKNAAGLGSMGFGLPYAIGSCIANGGRRTILINGDGAFQLNIQELETLHRLGLPVKMFIWNNGGYASIRAMQRNNFNGRYVASSAESGLTMPDISRVAAAYGFGTYRISDNRELDAVLPQIMADDTPLLCELMVLPEETVSPRVKAMVGENGEMVSGPLEHMWPYL